MEKYIVFFVQIKYGSLILFSKQVLINDVFLNIKKHSELESMI